MIFFKVFKTIQSTLVSSGYTREKDKNSRSGLVLKEQEPVAPEKSVNDSELYARMRKNLL